MAKQPQQNVQAQQGAPAQPLDMVKCPSCTTENKGKSKNCRKCGYNLTLPPLWIPSWKWHLKTLGIIYAVLVVAYFAINHFLGQLPPPYDLRDIPAEVTPWLKK